MLAAHHVDTEIGFTAQYRFQTFIGAQVEQSNPDFWIAFVVDTDHRRQEVERRGGYTGERYPTDLPFRQFTDIENRVVEVVQQSTCFG
ncbi:hypothetical protein D3C80_1775460 [compost metagenome]